MADASTAPEEGKVKIVYKFKKKRGGHGHHGGGWKVAFADFMTAMMALFLVLWILSQSQEVKQAVAYYFRHAADVEGDPSSVFKGNQGLMDFKNGRLDTPPSARDPEGKGASGQPGGYAGREAQSISGGPATKASSSTHNLTPPRPFEDNLKIDPDEYKKLLKISADLWDHMGMHPSYWDRIKDEVWIKSTETGFVVQLLEQDSTTLLDEKSERFRPEVRMVLKVISEAVAKMPDNKIEIQGHGKGLAEKDENRWLGSFLLADLARQELLANGVSSGQITQVSSCADTRLLMPDQPSQPMNRRVTIYVHHSNWNPKTY